VSENPLGPGHHDQKLATILRRGSWWTVTGLGRETTDMLMCFSSSWCCLGGNQSPAVGLARVDGQCLSLHRTLSLEIQPLEARGDCSVDTWAVKDSDSRFGFEAPNASCKAVSKVVAARNGSAELRVPFNLMLRASQHLSVDGPEVSSGLTFR